VAVRKDFAGNDLETSKIQDPSSREGPNFNQQASKRVSIAKWSCGHDTLIAIHARLAADSGPYRVFASRTARVGAWELGVSLDVGSWNLKLFSPSAFHFGGPPQGVEVNGRLCVQ
jgi:hypothetical protein